MVREHRIGNCVIEGRCMHDMSADWGSKRYQEHKDIVGRLYNMKM